MEKKTIVNYATDQSSHIVGVDMDFRDTDGYPWTVNDCINWCKEHGYDYEVKYY